MEFVKLVELESDPTESEELKGYLSKCQDLQIPLHYRLPKNYSLWYGRPDNQSNCKDFTRPLFNLSRIVSEKNEFFIRLENEDIENLKQLGDISVKNVKRIFCFCGNELQPFNGYFEIKNYYFKKDGGEKKHKTLPYDFSRRLLDGFYSVCDEYSYDNIKEENISYIIIKKFKKHRNYYFRESNIEDDISYSYEPAIINIASQDIYLNQDDLHKLNELPSVSDIPESSPYSVPLDYRKYSFLCRLAEIGYYLFELPGQKSKKSLHTRSVKAGIAFLKEQGIAKQTKFLDSAYFLINNKISAGSDVKEIECPQIQHLLKISNELDIETKEKEVQDLFKSEPKWRYALTLITEVE